MNIGKVTHSPKEKPLALPGEEAKDVSPNPANGRYYTVEELEGMTEPQRQWIIHHQKEMEDAGEDLIDYEDDSV
ncbi:hypothetical protein PTTG_30287, partial [Puccinia triticina 1-1 BBBD Race 1]